MSNVDGAAAFLGLEARHDLTADFRSASMKRNPDLPFSLPANVQEALEIRADYAAISKKIDETVTQARTAETTEARDELRIQTDMLYQERRKLREQELKAYQSSLRRAYNVQDDVLRDCDWRRTYFDDAVRHMVPGRARLAETLPLAVSLRSEQGISALRDLLGLLTSDLTVAYQTSLRPTNGRCRVPACDVDITW